MEGEYHLCASLWILNRAGQLLIQKRADTKKIGPGIWSVTGGCVKAGESSRRGCVREVWEELGLEIPESEPDLLARTFGARIIFDDYIIRREFQTEDLVLQREEVSAVRWALPAEIESLFAAGLFLYQEAELKTVLQYVREHFEET